MRSRSRRTLDEMPSIDQKRQSGEMAGAWTLASSILADELPRRWAHSQGVGDRALDVGPALASTTADLTVLAQAAILHDVGYSQTALETGFHALDGARYLRSLDVDDQVVNLVAHHSCAAVEAHERGLDKALAEFPVGPPALTDGLIFCDMTVSPDGLPVSVDDRISEILTRYGTDSIVGRFIARAEPELRAAVHRIAIQFQHSGLEDAVRYAAQHAVVSAPAGSGTSGLRRIVWGRELDVQVVTLSGDGAAQVTEQQVAGYLAKYATKAAETTGTLDRSVACWHCKGSGTDSSGVGRCGRCGGRGSKYEIADLPLNPHAKAMIQTCWDLGADLALEELRLRPWAHMLGFRGHFSTKSRRYSTTLTKLRSARLEWRNARLLRSLDRPEGATLHHLEEDLDPDAEIVLTVGNWQYLGRGHTAGQALYARTIAEDMAEERRLARLAPLDEWEEPA